MNVQEYVDSEVAKGNTDIHIPDGLEPCNTLKFPAGIRITFPWMPIQQASSLGYLEMVEQAFPGKECSIEYRKTNGGLFRTYDITIRVDNCAARRAFDRSELAESKVSQDEWMTYEIGHMIHGVQHEFDKLKQKRGEINGRDSSQETRR
jgi:hypothetical protein